MMLIDNFKPYLKTEIGVIVDSIFLKILASPNSTYEHKMMSLTVIKKLCVTDESILMNDMAPTIVDIFLNYDCETDDFNIFQQIIDQLEKIAKGRYGPANWMSVEQENELRVCALECLNCILNSLVSWSKEAHGKRKDLAVESDSHSDHGDGSRSPSLKSKKECNQDQKSSK